MRAFLKIEMNFDLKQPVNQWISIVFLGCLTLLVVITFLSYKAEAIGKNITTTSYSELLEAGLEQ